MMTPDDLLEAQERCLYAIATCDLPVSGDSSTLDTLRGRLLFLRAQLTEWLIDGGYEPRWERWPVAAKAFRPSVR